MTVIRTVLEHIFKDSLVPLGSREGPSAQHEGMVVGHHAL